jgi:hypothetical protein
MRAAPQFAAGAPADQQAGIDVLRGSRRRLPPARMARWPGCTTVTREYRASQGCSQQAGPGSG